MSLEGVSVVEVSAFVAAPLAGMTLASLGAEVIRVDPPGGGLDYHRWPVTVSGKSLYWHGLNRAKRSVVIDWRRDEGRELVAALATRPGLGAGMFLTNLGAAGALKYERLRGRREDVISVEIRGYDDGSSAVDYTIAARSGVPYLTGMSAMDGPVNSPLPTWDVAAGFNAALAMVMALRQRERMGAGGRVRIALADVALSVLASLGFVDEERSAEEPRVRDGNYLYGAFGRDFKLRDGSSVMLVAITTRQWEAVVEAFDIADEIEALEGACGLDCAEEGDRYRGRVQIAKLIEGRCATLGAAEVVAALEGHKVCWSRYETASSFADAVLGGAAFGAGEQLMTDLPSPLRIQGQNGSPVGRAPVLGEDTESVLADRLGLTACEIGKLRDAGIVARVEAET